MGGGATPKRGATTQPSVLHRLVVIRLRYTILDTVQACMPTTGMPIPIFRVRHQTPLSCVHVCAKVKTMVKTIVAGVNWHDKKNFRRLFYLSWASHIHSEWGIFLDPYGSQQCESFEQLWSLLGSTLFHRTQGFKYIARCQEPLSRQFEGMFKDQVHISDKWERKLNARG